MTLRDFFYGKLNPLKYGISDIVEYDSTEWNEIYSAVKTNQVGKIIKVEQHRGCVQNYYWIIFDDEPVFKMPDGEDVPVGLPENKLKLIHSAKNNVC